MTEITDSTNFCRVFEIPTDYPEGFLFSGGKPVSFKMVDWFNPIPPTDLWAGGELKGWDHYEPMIAAFVAKKNYIRKGCRYLILTDFDKAIIIRSQP